MFLVVLALLALPACGGDGGGEPTQASGSGPGQVITGFNGESADFRAMHELAREQPGELRTAALDELGSRQSNVRYAAVYGLAMTAEGRSLERLRGLLESEDVSERVLAAEALVSRGEAAGLPVLIEALGSEEGLRFRDPPQRAWELARLLLVQYRVRISASSATASTGRRRRRRCRPGRPGGRSGAPPCASTGRSVCTGEGSDLSAGSARLGAPSGRGAKTTVSVKGRW